jgi:hypothetical protein
MKPTRDKSSRLALTIEDGRRLQRFLDDSLIRAILDDMHDDAVEQMIAAASDEDRRCQAYMIKIIRQFRATLADKAKAGERAVKVVDQQTQRFS